MSGECDKCGEHTLECVCNIDPAIKLAATIIARNVQDTEVQLAFDTLKKAGVLEEFKEFYEKGKTPNLFEAITEFAKLHPDKFYVPEKTERYGKFIVIN